MVVLLRNNRWPRRIDNHRVNSKVIPDNGKTERLGGNNRLVVDGNNGTAKIEVDLLDNGKEISNGPNNLGTVMADKTGAHKDGPPYQLQRFWFSTTMERPGGTKPMAARLDSANSGSTMVAAHTGWLAESTGWATTTGNDSSSTMDCTAAPRLYACEEGYLHYPQYTQTMWADVGNTMYGYMAKHLNLIPDAPNLGEELSGDVVEIAYNLYFMYATLHIDVASLLGIDQTILAGWWAQVTMIQRDAYIQSATMLGGKGTDTSRFEQVCIYISGLTQLTAILCEGNHFSDTGQRIP